jgi:hypothetical protein
MFEKWTPEREERSRQASSAFARTSVFTRMNPQSVEDIYGPGRSSLQWSVVFSALAILVPMLSVVAVFFALRCRHQHGPRWLVALVAALWCALLGSAFRAFGGLPIIP